MPAEQFPTFSQCRLQAADRIGTHGMAFRPQAQRFFFRTVEVDNEAIAGVMKAPHEGGADSLCASVISATGCSLVMFHGLDFLGDAGQAGFIYGCLRFGATGGQDRAAVDGAGGQQ